MRHRKLLMLILIVVVVVGVFAGCKKKIPVEETKTYAAREELISFFKNDSYYFKWGKVNFDDEKNITAIDYTMGKDKARYCSYTDDTEHKSVCIQNDEKSFIAYENEKTYSTDSERVEWSLYPLITSELQFILENCTFEKSTKKSDTEYIEHFTFNDGNKNSTYEVLIKDNRICEISEFFKDKLVGTYVIYDYGTDFDESVFDFSIDGYTKINN
ncbi:MAG: hypothetical protein ACI4KH_01585 [Oscillospiraceae bacterium]